MRIALLEFICGSDLLHDSNSNTAESAVLETVQRYRSLDPSPQTAPPKDSIADLASEGFAMLSAMAEDLVDCGHEVLTLVHPAVPRILGVAVDTMKCRPRILHEASPWESQWHELANTCDKVLLIAPDNELASLVEGLDQQGVKTCNCAPPLIELAADKWKLMRSAPFTQSQFDSSLSIDQPDAYRHPPTLCFSDILRSTNEDTKTNAATPSTDSLLSLRANSDSGWVIKDRYGAGCVGTRFLSDSLFAKFQKRIESVRNNNELNQLFLQFDNTLETDWLVQPWIQGVPISFSCMLRGDASPIYVGAMVQRISIADRSEADEPNWGQSIAYGGGSGPVLESHRGYLQLWCNNLLYQVIGSLGTEAMSHSFGWIGIDAILEGVTIQELDKLTAEEIQRRVVFLEINPRLTSSYLGFRSIFGPNLANCVVDTIDETRPEFSRSSFSQSVWDIETVLPELLRSTGVNEHLRRPPTVEFTVH